MKIYFRDEQTGYDIDKGWTYTRNANETLDSAVIRISHLMNKLDIQPFDNVHIEDDSETPVPILNFAGDALYTLYLCVDSYTETQVSLDPVIYNYEIHLFSETKKLENIILPNLSITPKKLSTPLTIREFIEQVWRLYCPKKRENGSWVDEYTLPDTWLSSFSNVCPEKQWTTPTLRDVLNDLAMVCDCIPTMANNTVSFLDITTKKSAITSYNYVTRNRSSQDYATDLKMNLQNVMQENVIISTYESLTFTSDGAVVNDENLYLKTQFPILNIKHLWVKWCSGTPQGANPNPIFIKADLCNLKFANDTQTYSIVKEKKFFDILEVSKYANVNQINEIEPYTHYKNYCLWYNRGSNIISGFSAVNKLTLLNSISALAQIMMFAEVDALLRLGETPLLTCLSGYNYGLDETSNVWFFPTFEIEYETTKECVFSASKKELLRNERTIMDNQTNAWVNAAAQGNLEYQKANRIGNEVAMINQRITDGNPADIFQRLGNEIIYRTEYQIFDNYVDVNAYATKDYILRDYFTGVNSKIRTWVNARDEAFVRHDLYKYYVEFDTQEYNDIISYSENYVAYGLRPYTSDIHKNAFNCFISPLKSFKTISYCLMRCGPYPENHLSFVVNFVRRIIGNSIVITWGFDDNYVGITMPNFGTHANSGVTPNDDGKLELDDFDNATTRSISGTSLQWVIPPRIKSGKINDLGGVPLRRYNYCDDDGNFGMIHIRFVSNLDDSSIVNGANLVKLNYYNHISSQLNEDGYSTMPNQSDGLEFDADVYKDNKEIITGSLQIEYISNNSKIVIYDNFLKLNALFGGTSQSMFIYTNDSPNTIPAQHLDPQLASMDVSYTTNSAHVTLTIDNSVKKKYVWIGPNNTTPILRLDTITDFYINLLRKRDKTGL